MSMYRIFKAVMLMSAVVYLLSSSSYAQPVDDPVGFPTKGACSVATLQGNYILTGHSEFAPRSSREDPTTYPRVQVGVQTFDGKATVSTVVTHAQAGDIRYASGSGPYTLNDDCTGTIMSGQGINWEIVVTRDGTEGEYIRVDQGTVSRRSTKKQ